MAGIDLSILKESLCPAQYVNEVDEPWDHSQLFQKVIFELNSQI